MFGPASRSFQAVAITAFVVCLPLALVVWNRVRGPVPLRVLQRLGLLLACQLTAVSALFATVNQANDFYVTWGELAGAAAPGDVQIVPDGSGPRPGTTAPTTVTSAGAPSAPAAPATPSGAPATTFTPDGTGLLVAQVHGPRSGVDGQIMVWTPPGYSPTGAALPVLLTLDGSPGNPVDTYNGLQLVAKETALLAAGTVPPTLLVSATTNVDGTDWGCSNAPGGDPQVATWLTQDVPDIISASFHVQPVASRRWQVMGYSSGATCSVRLALTTPALFSAAVSLAGSNVPDAHVLSGTAQATKDNDLRTLAAAGTPRPVALLLAASKQDSSTSSDALSLQRAVGRNVTADLELVTRGGHNWDTWQAMTSPALTWLAQHTGG